MKPSIKNFIEFNPRVGVDSMHITAYPGMGKSVQATDIMIQCIRNGEIGIMPGDRFVSGDTWITTRSTSRY